MKDLFGNETTLSPNKRYGHESEYQQFKRVNNYGSAVYKDKSCKHCVNKRKFHYNGKNYYKCILIGVSHSEATDIRLNRVCDKFEEGEL